MDEIDKLHVRMQGFRKQDVADRAKVSRFAIANIMTRRVTNYRKNTLDKINLALDDMGARKI